jgi:hypothetical protein
MLYQPCCISYAASVDEPSVYSKMYVHIQRLCFVLASHEFCALPVTILFAVLATQAGYSAEDISSAASCISAVSVIAAVAVPFTPLNPCINFIVRNLS